MLGIDVFREFYKVLYKFLTFVFRIVNADRVAVIGHYSELLQIPFSVL